MAFHKWKSVQMSDSVQVMIPLTISGGLQDAYSYFTRGKVFANAQTGNIVLMSHELFSGNLSGCLRYLIPVLAFAFGVIAADIIRSFFRAGGRVHWRQLVLLVQVILLAVVGILPENLNWLANVLTSFSCAMQVQSFRSVEGSAYASTMCIGNLRSGMDHLSAAISTHDRGQLFEAGKYGVILLLFIVGAGLGSVLTRFLGMRAIWISCLLLAVSFIFMMTHRPEK